MRGLYRSLGSLARALYLTRSGYGFYKELKKEFNKARTKRARDVVQSVRVKTRREYHQNPSYFSKKTETGLQRRKQRAREIVKNRRKLRSGDKITLYPGMGYHQIRRAVVSHLVDKGIKRVFEEPEVKREFHTRKAAARFIRRVRKGELQLPHYQELFIREKRAPLRTRYESAARRVLYRS